MLLPFYYTIYFCSVRNFYSHKGKNMIHQKGTPAPIVAEEEKKETIVRTIKLQTAGREEIIHVGAKVDVNEVDDTLKVNFGDSDGCV